MTTASATARQDTAAERAEPFVLIAAEDGLHHGSRPAEHLLGRSVTAVTATDPSAAWALVDGTDVVRVTPDRTEKRQPQRLTRPMHPRTANPEPYTPEGARPRSTGSTDSRTGSSDTAESTF